MTGIDQLAYGSALRDTHPGEKAFLAISAMLLVIGLDSLFISALVLAFMSGLIMNKARIPHLLYLKIMAVPLGFLLLSCLTIAVNVGYGPADNICRLSWGPLEIGTSRASLAQALNLLAKSLAAVSCLSFLALTTPMVQIIYICRRIKIPTVIIDLMVLVYFNIFVFLAKAEEIHTAQLSRCGYRGFRGSIKSLSLLGASLFVKGLKTSRESFDCMQARCFSGQYRVIEDAYYPNPKNLAAILGFDLLLIAVHLFLNFEF